MKVKDVKELKTLLKQNKKATLFISAAFVLCLVLVLVLCFVFQKEPESFTGKQYYVPNYEEDIFQNKAYLSYQRDLSYSVSGVEQLFNFEEDYESADNECKFFLSYFQTVINGDYEKLPDFYVEDYFEDPVKFTMQMIYEPRVVYHSVSGETIDGKEVTLINYHVEYKIFKNNETFRSDIPSNTAIPQIYQLIKNDDGSYQIYRILDVKPENEN